LVLARIGFHRFEHALRPTGQQSHALGQHTLRLQMLKQL
jgi:hypothetical protein